MGRSSSLQAGRRGPAEGGGGTWSDRRRKGINLPYIITPDESRWSPRVFQGFGQGNRVRVSAEAAECLVPGAKQQLAAAGGEPLPVPITFWDVDREAWTELLGVLKRDSEWHYYLSVDSQKGLQGCTLVECVTGVRGRRPVVLSVRNGWVVLAPCYDSWKLEGQQQQQHGETEQGLEGDGAQGWHDSHDGDEDAGVRDPGQSNVQLPAGSVGTSPEPRVFELPPGTPVPQLPQPVLWMDVTGPPKHREVVFAVNMSAANALFPEAIRQGKGFMVAMWHGSGSKGGLTFTDVLLRPAEPTAGGGGGAAAGGGTWVGTASAASGLQEALLARDFGAAVLSTGLLRLKDQVGPTGPIVRASCLPQPPALQDTGAGGGAGGRRTQQRRQGVPSVNSSDPADSATARAEVAQKAIKEAEVIKRKAYRAAARARAMATMARETTTKLQQQDPSGLGLEEPMGVGRAKAKAKTKMTARIPSEMRVKDAVGMTNQEAEEARPLEEDPGVKAWRAAREARSTAVILRAAGGMARRSADKAEAAAAGVQAVWEQKRKDKEQVGLDEAKRAALEAEEEEAKVSRDLALAAAVEAVMVSDKARDFANELLRLAEAAEEAAKVYDQRQGS